MMNDEQHADEEILKAGLDFVAGMEDHFYIVEESAIKAAIAPPDDHPIWDWFADGPVLQLKGEPVKWKGHDAVKIKHGGIEAVLPLDAVTEIE